MSQYTQAKALLESLKSIPDYRVDTGKIEYPLHQVLFMVICKKRTKSDTHSVLVRTPMTVLNRTVMTEMIRTLSRKKR